MASVFICWLSGCMTAGEQLDKSAVAKLQKGQDRSEVRKVFGVPKRTETGANGKRLDLYQVVFVRRIPEPQRALVIRSLCVRFDQSDRVEDFVRHVGELPIRETPMGWEAGEPLDEPQIRGIQREAHSRFNLEATFGPPAFEGLDRNGDVCFGWYHLQEPGGFVRTGHELLVSFDSANRVQDFLLRELQW